jgi:PAS domain S-box-containing protein
VTLGGRTSRRHLIDARTRSLLELAAVVAASLAFYALCAVTNAYERLRDSVALRRHPIEDDLLLALPFALLLLAVYAWRRYREARRHAERLGLAERALARTSEEYRSLFDYHPHAVFALDPQRTYRRLNAAAEQLGGYSAAEMRGQTFPALREPGDRAELVAAFDRALAGDGAHLQASIVRKDGQRRAVDIEMLPIIVAGEAVGVYVVAGDVTEANRLRADLADAVVKAQEASDAKTLLLANVSHELRTPLTGILAAAEMLEDLTDEGPHANLLGRIERNGHDLIRLVDDLLDVTRLETGQLVLDHVGFDLRRVVEQAASTVAAKAHAKGLALEVIIEDSAPDRIVADPVRLGHVLTNLLGNAVKFTETGGITLRAGHQQSADGGRVVLTVSDTGIGIAPENQQRVFDRFMQADPSSTRRHGGAGLGLHITRQLVELMGGDIALTSEVGVGTTVQVSLPAATD